MYFLSNNWSSNRDIETGTLLPVVLCCAAPGVVRRPAAIWCGLWQGEAVACIGRILYQVLCMAASTVPANQYGFGSRPKLPYEPSWVARAQEAPLPRL